MKDIKVDLYKWNTKDNNIRIHILELNGVSIMLTKQEYEAIEKTL